MFKAQEDWEGGANRWRGVGGAVHIRKSGDPLSPGRRAVGVLRTHRRSGGSKCDTPILRRAIVRNDPVRVTPNGGSDGD
jgi:hypothetical protein